MSCINDGLLEGRCWLKYSHIVNRALGQFRLFDHDAMSATNLTKRVLEQRFVHVGTFTIGLDERRFARRSSTLS